MDADKIYKALKIIEIVRDYPSLPAIHGLFMRQLNEAEKQCAEELKKIQEEEAKKKAEQEAKAKAPPAPPPPPPPTPPQTERRV